MLQRSFAALALLWIGLIARQAKMSFFASGTSVFSAALPLLLCAPKFLSGEMTLGDVMQASAAFVQVHTALNWPADNALSIANWAHRPGEWRHSILRFALRRNHSEWWC